MRILEVTEASGSGTLGVVCAIAAHAAAEGHEVALAYGERPETPPDLRGAAGPAVELIALPWRTRTPWAQLVAARELRRLVARWRPDVVHLHSTFAGLVGALALGRSAPRVYTAHGFASARTADGAARAAAYRAVERLVAARCDLVGAVSEAEAAIARGLGARRVVIVPNGVPELDPGGMPAPVHRDGPLVLAAGRIGPARRPAEAARILSAVRDVAATAWIGGGPSPADEVPLREAGIPVTGWLPHAEALDRLGGATAYLHWSAWDGQPLAILEAFARDVVVVASDIPANRELLGEHQVCTGEDEAAGLLRRVVTDAALRHELLEAQRARRGEHGARRMSRAWLEHYAACASSAPAPSGGSLAPTASARRTID
jgi:glycosyltransferase involved in cell wall biosynthesis